MMLRMISGFWLSRALYAAAKLGLADLLKNGPRTVDDLAKLSSTHAPSLYRVLRALASAGVFSERPTAGSRPRLYPRPSKRTRQLPCAGSPLPNWAKTTIRRGPSFGTA